MKGVFKCLIPSCITVVLLSGCWDELSIEERNFSTGTAIDLVDEENREDSTISLTHQFVVPSGVGTPEGGAEEDVAYDNVTAEGKNPSAISQHIASMTSRFPSYSHLSTLIFSEELAEEENAIAELADMFLRNTQMRRSMRVFIADGEAKDMLEIDENPETLPTQYIRRNSERNENNMETIDTLELGTMQRYLMEENSYVLPYLKLHDGKLHSKKAAVFHGTDNKLTGTLNGRETKGYNLATQSDKEGTVNMKVNGDPMVFEMGQTKNNLTVDVDDPQNIEASIQVDVEGFLEEMFGSKSLLEDDYLTEIGDAAADKMETLIKETIEKSQDVLQTDILGVSEKLKEKHYNVWKKIHDDWEDGEHLFDDVTFHVNVDVRLEDISSSDRTKRIE